MPDQLTLTGVDPLSDVVCWRRANPEAWRAVVEWAHQDRAAGIDPSTRMYCCILRRPHFAARLGLRRMNLRPVLVNDHLSSNMARLLNRDYPDLKCPTRRSSVDSWRAAS